MVPFLRLWCLLLCHVDCISILMAYWVFRTKYNTHMHIYYGKKRFDHKNNRYSRPMGFGTVCPNFLDLTIDILLAIMLILSIVQWLCNRSWCLACLTLLFEQVGITTGKTPCNVYLDAAFLQRRCIYFQLYHAHLFIQCHLYLIWQSFSWSACCVCQFGLCISAIS
jgi:hypothetical protein